MKKNYLKPLCMTTPMRGLRILDGSMVINNTKVGTTDGGFSRGVDNYDDGGAISPRSVWDD